MAATQLLSETVPGEKTVSCTVCCSHECLIQVWHKAKAAAAAQNIMSGQVMFSSCLPAMFPGCTV